MTLNEFKAWLEGYSASFEDGAPNAEQWMKIIGKLDSVKHPTEFKSSFRDKAYPRQPDRWFEPNIALLKIMNPALYEKSISGKTVAPQ